MQIKKNPFSQKVTNTFDIKRAFYSEGRNEKCHYRSISTTPKIIGIIWCRQTSVNIMIGKVIKYLKFIFYTRKKN